MSPGPKSNKFGLEKKMNIIIISPISRRGNNFFLLQCIFVVLVIIGTLAVDINSQSNPKHNEQDNARITIGKAKVKKIKVEKVIGKWRIAVWILKDAFCWLALGIASVYVFGKFGWPIGWYAMSKSLVATVAGMSILEEYPSEEMLSKKCKIARIVLVVALMIAGMAFCDISPPVDIQACNIWMVASVSTAPDLNMTAGEIGNIQFQANYEQFRRRYKLTIEQQFQIYRALIENPEITSKELLAAFPDITITANQLNRIRKEWDLSRKRGRPRLEEVAQREKPETKTFSHVPKAGLRLFALWLESTGRYQDVLETLYKMIEEYKKAYPDEDFRLLKTSRKTIAEKWKALNLLALAGIKKLSELDYQQHDLDRILVDGKAYSYSTLRQFLGELERINAGLSLKNLLPQCATGDWAYIDGHMIALWSRVKSHKGYITMLGRIMPGSKLVATHDEIGQIIDFNYYPADTHLTKIIEDYCAHIVAHTGITNFVIDREINSVDVARVFDKRGWGLICLLAANEYKGLDSFRRKFAKRLPDGTILYKALWSPWRDDPRRFIIVKEIERTLVYWYTEEIFKQGLTAEQIITIYRRRAEIQENDFKRMTAHGALNTNFGHKKVWVPDRTHQRKIDEIDKKIAPQRKRLEKVRHQIFEVMLKLCESIERGHGRLYEIRFAKLERLEILEEAIQANISELEREKEELGPSGKKADRDFRKQTIMTFRTLWTENALREFVSLLTKSMEPPVGIETVLELFFYRRGVVVESTDRVVYWIDSQNLSDRYQGILREVTDHFNRLLLTYRGKRIVVKIADSVQSF